MDRLARKFETARTLVPKPVVEDAHGAAVGIIGLRHQPLGHRRVPRSAASGKRGIKTGYLRLRAFPSPTS